MPRNSDNVSLAERASSRPIHLRGLAPAREALRALHREGGSIGSVHSLGALHAGHARVIQLAARENDHVVVTVYPNKAQLAPGSSYDYDLGRDVDWAIRHGATHVISAEDGQMYPREYCTHLDQGPRYSRLDGTVVPFLFRGMITMCLRWICFVRPQRTYWGLKDIGQYLLVKRAVEDLLIDTDVREVPCVRYRSGIPISSRLMSLDQTSLAEVARVHWALESARKLIAAGERRSSMIVRHVREILRQQPLRAFEIVYVKVARADEFSEPDEVSLPFILHVVLTNGKINHFDGMLIRNEAELLHGPETIWLEEEWPTSD